MKYIQIISGILLLILLIGLGFFIGQKTKQCPEIKIGKETTFISIIVHDTVLSKKNNNDIKVVKEIKTVIKTDTLHDTIVTLKKDTVSDTSTCFSFDEIESDGAYIKATICSDSFKIKPDDLYGEILYKAAPDTFKQINRIDTVSIVKKPAPFKTWKDYVLLVLAAVIAASFIPRH